MSQEALREFIRKRGMLYPVNHPLPPGLGPIGRREFVKIAGATGAVLAVGAGSFGCQPGAAPVTGSGPAPDPAEKELALLALDEARSAGASYVDVRISRHWNESVSTREQQITNVSKRDSYGIGVRALVGGSWGFSATRDVSRDAVVAAAREATAIAAANDGIAPSETVLAPVDAVPDGRWVTPHEVDPFDVSVEEKAALLFSANEEAMRVAGVQFVSSNIGSVKESRLVATSEGSVIQQTFIRTNPSMNITAVSSD